MEKHRKQAVIISTIGVVMILFGVTYSFFNYTRTGVSNTIRVGRIYFNSEQTNTITLVDVFPIDKTTVNSSNDVGTVTINIEGDTTYDDGVEYQLTVSNLTNTVGNKEIPIDVVVTASGVGDSEDDYFNERGGNSSIYKVLTTGTISNNKQLLVGYIPKGSTGVDGTVTIKAYLDKEKIAISDTYPASSHIDVEGEDIFDIKKAFISIFLIFILFTLLLFLLLFLLLLLLLFSILLNDNNLIFLSLVGDILIFGIEKVDLWLICLFELIELLFNNVILTFKFLDVELLIVLKLVELGENVLKLIVLNGFGLFL